MAWVLGLVSSIFKRAVSSASAFIGLENSNKSTVFYSLDGLTWDYGNPSNPVSIMGKTAAGTYFGIDSDKFLTSTDRQNWTVVNTLPTGQTFIKVVYGEQAQRYVGIAYDSNTSTHFFNYSSNGSTWTRGIDTTMTQLETFEGGFVAIESQFSNTYFSGSTNGVNWSNYNLPTTGYPTYPKLQIANNKAFIIAFGGANSASTRLFQVFYNFSIVTYTIPSGRYANIVFGNGRYVMNDYYSPASYNGVNVITSTNLSTWSARSTVGSGYGMAWPFMAYGANKFIIIPNYGDSIVYSSDGLSWSAAPLPYVPPQAELSVADNFSAKIFGIQYQV